jgi:ribose/xylose/arabinose/galactoside ABC-type transport system permease subunit
MAGGYGGVLHTLLGVSLSAVITNGMVVVGIAPYWQQIVYGVIIIVAIATTENRQNKDLIVK